VSRRKIVLLLFVVVAAALLFTPLSMSTTLAGATIENAGHTPLFTVGTLCILVVLRYDYSVTGWRLYLFAFLLGTGGGLLSEAIQAPLHRDASWEDAIADAVGALLALGMYAFVDEWSRPRRWWRAGALAVMAACVFVYLMPIVSVTRAYLYRNGQFPAIAQFTSPLELYWLYSYGVNREIRDGGLEVSFEASEFPGFTFYEPMPDWRGYQVMVIDVENLDDAPLFLGVRVNDVGRGLVYGDRFNRTTEVPPRARRAIEFSLEDVRHGPRNRLMDMAQISDVTVFRGKDAGSRHMRLYSIRLR
jgi:hypothetical protein